jgi:16S rRNA (guanine527-N7)-methyltransferase
MTELPEMQVETRVSRETMGSLDFLSAQIKKWNPSINLVSKSSLDHMLQRHIRDSMQLYDLAPKSMRHWADLGSGGGFPGLVIAIIAREQGYPALISLVESDTRKSVFLKEIVRELGLRVTVINERIESLPPLNVDVLSARGLAPLARLCRFAHHHMLSTGLAIFPKGENYVEEVKQAQKTWHFSMTVTPSTTEPRAAILRLSGLKHV